MVQLTILFVLVACAAVPGVFCKIIDTGNSDGYLTITCSMASAGPLPDLGDRRIVAKITLSRKIPGVTPGSLTEQILARYFPDTNTKWRRKTILKREPGWFYEMTGGQEDHEDPGALIGNADSIELKLIIKKGKPRGTKNGKLISNFRRSLHLQHSVDYYTCEFEYIDSNRWLKTYNASMAGQEQLSRMKVFTRVMRGDDWFERDGALFGSVHTSKHRVAWAEHGGNATLTFKVPVDGAKHIRLLRLGKNCAWSGRDLVGFYFTRGDGELRLGSSFKMYTTRAYSIVYVDGDSEFRWLHVTFGPVHFPCDGGKYRCLIRQTKNEVEDCGVELRQSGTNHEGEWDLRPCRTGGSQSVC